MKYTQSLKAGALAAVLSVAWLASSAAAADAASATPTTPAAIEELGETFATIAVPAGLTSAEVKEAIVTALTRREWGVKSANDDRVVGYLKHRSNEAQVTFLYTTTSIEMHCVGWQIDKKTGIREKPELPKGWLNYLRNDLIKRFNGAVTKK